ncbi:MAG: hypothetical protein J6T82_07045 [Bacteroidaceae bacterium]|nr:hypothetical protein [Bacteroidaceae bacterium]
MFSVSSVRVVALKDFGARVATNGMPCCGASGANTSLTSLVQAAAIRATAAMPNKVLKFFIL